MLALSILVAQAAMVLAVAVFVCSQLTAPTRSMLLQLCGSHVIAAFWSRMLVVMVVLAPLVAVLAFGAPPAGQQAFAVELWLRRSLALVASGAAVPVLVLAYAVWRQVPAPAAVDRGDER